MTEFHGVFVVNDGKRLFVVKKKKILRETPSFSVSSVSKNALKVAARKLETDRLPREGVIDDVQPRKNSMDYRPHYGMVGAPRDRDCESAAETDSRANWIVPVRHRLAP